MKKKIFIILLTIFSIICSGCEPLPEKWTYKDLPNNYAIKKTSDTELVIGKYIDGIFEIETKDKKIGIETYIAEFQKSENYIGLKCLKNENNELSIFFYIIDTKEEDIYGPYNTEETYQAVMDKIVDEEFGEWIKTIEKPEGAISE
ncbi:MAG: hypothetical protein E7168_01040 [Firmicutes bacterium]|nr:hypothetical protein [Bacillota bacterium]